MDKEIKESYKQYLLYPTISFIIGVLIGVRFCLYKLESKSTKKYPIEVQCYWSTNGYQSYPSMDADSIKGDTIYKDGSVIVNKNIINVSYK
jgi:hypothetical protein